MKKAALAKLATQEPRERSEAESGRAHELEGAESEHCDDDPEEKDDDDID